MNAPVMTGSSASVIMPDQGRVALPLSLGILMLGALFNREVMAAVQTWNASTAYNHCFLVIPIALYLLWDRRPDLVGVSAQPFPPILLLALPLSVAWLVAERLGIMEGRQLVAISFVEVLFLAILGKRLWWAMAGPLLYLYFLVPFGEFLTPQLQDVTTFFIRHGLEILGVPAYIDGYIIEIPQGTFFVAEACAGLRFLIASIAFGCLYALIMYRSPMRRGVFIVVSMVVPIIANGLRGIGIVYLGYILGSAQAAAADHIIYGWIFFSAVILLLIALGLPFRQDGIATRVRSDSDHLVTRRFSAVGLGGLVAAVLALAAVSPALAAVLSAATTSLVAIPAVIDVGKGCSVHPNPPSDVDVTRLQSQRVTCGAQSMDMTWTAFSPRITAAPLMAERRRLVSRAATEGLSESWLDAHDGAPNGWRIMRSNEPAFMIAVAMWVDGQPARPGLAMRLRLAMNSVLGSGNAPMVVTVTPVVDWDKLGWTQRQDAEASLTAFLIQHRDLDNTIGTLSTLH